MWTKVIYIILRLTFDILQGRHLNCSAESACKKEGYSKVQLQDPGAIAAYTKKLKETLIYTNADSYCHVSDNFNIFPLEQIFLGFPSGLSGFFCILFQPGSIRSVSFLFNFVVKSMVYL